MAKLPIFRATSLFSTHVELQAEYLYGVNPVELALAANRRKI